MGKYKMRPFYNKTPKRSTSTELHCSTSAKFAKLPQYKLS